MSAIPVRQTVKFSYTGMQNQTSQMDPVVQLLVAWAGTLAGQKSDWLGFLPTPHWQNLRKFSILCNAIYPQEMTYTRPSGLLCPLQIQVSLLYRVTTGSYCTGTAQLVGRAGGSPLQELLFQSPSGCDQGTARSCPMEKPAPYNHQWSFGISCNGRCSPGQIPVSVTINITLFCLFLLQPNSPRVAQTTLMGCVHQQTSQNDV